MGGVLKVHNEHVVHQGESNLARGRNQDSEIAVDLSSWVASINLHAQEGFLEALGVAQERSGISVEQAAERIGASVEAITQALTGGTDLNLSEIRHLAIALDAIVEFRVTNAHEAWRANRVQQTADAIAEVAWDELPKADDLSVDVRQEQ